MQESFVSKEEPTSVYLDQKAGTSGLRKKVTVFTQPNYLDNFVQAIFDSVPVESRPKNPSLVVSGDGRYWNNVAIDKILKIAAANSVHHVIIGQNGLLSTPALSHLIRKLNKDSEICMGGIVLTASHNPGGEHEDFGIKYNSANGGPAQEALTDLIFEKTKTLTRVMRVPDLPQIDISQVQEASFQVDGGDFKVSVIDATEDYVEMMRSIFDFDQLQKLLARKDFSLCFDGMHGVSGPYARKIFVDILAVPADQVMRCDVLPDFGGAHPDPNLTYAPELVEKMGVFNSQENAPSFGAACDGDADRNMILGRHFFVTPSDSLAIIAAHHKRIPFFKAGIPGAARSMPTSAAVDRVCEKLGIPVFETPTGWKFFGNLLDAGRIALCGEESFGTGSNHVREKDGLWAVLCWLQILADVNSESSTLISVEQIVREHWATFGRNYYQRYDYEGIEDEKAAEVFTQLEASMSTFEAREAGNTATNFSYTDPVDGSVSKNQGYIFSYADGSRFVFRKSGTGSSGTTIRIYLEKYSSDPNQDITTALKAISDDALALSKIHEHSGRSSPTVIT